MHKTITTLVLGAVVLATAPTVSATGGVGVSADATAISCIKTAVTTREASLKTGITEFNTAVSDAYTERADALDDAYSNDTNDEVKSGVKAAWKAFKSDVKEARADWKKTQKDAWAKFKTDKKACRAPSAIDDSTNQSSEV